MLLVRSTVPLRLLLIGFWVSYIRWVNNTAPGQVTPNGALVFKREKTKGGGGKLRGNRKSVSCVRLLNNSDFNGSELLTLTLRRTGLEVSMLIQDMFKDKKKCMESPCCRVRPYSAKSILILMMMAGFGNVLACCKSMFSFVRLGREEMELPFERRIPHPPRHRAARVPFSTKMCVCLFLRVVCFPALLGCHLAQLPPFHHGTAHISPRCIFNWQSKEKRI